MAGGSPLCSRCFFTGRKGDSSAGRFPLKLVYWRPVPVTEFPDSLNKLGPLGVVLQLLA